MSLLLFPHRNIWSNAFSTQSVRVIEEKTPRQPEHGRHLWTGRKSPSFSGAQLGETVEDLQRLIKLKLPDEEQAARTNYGGLGPGAQVRGMSGIAGGVPPPWLPPGGGSARASRYGGDVYHVFCTSVVMPGWSARCGPRGSSARRVPEGPRERVP